MGQYLSGAARADTVLTAKPARSHAYAWLVFALIFALLLHACKLLLLLF